MREMIVSELSQAMQELARGFAHYLPRFVVMVVFVLLGWAIAYAVKLILLGVLRLAEALGGPAYRRRHRPLLLHRRAAGDAGRQQAECALRRAAAARRRP